MEPVQARPQFRADINGLRALSVGLVLVYHLGLKGSAGGFIGVDVFLVISGFLMTRIICDGLERETFELWRFIQARAWRLFPALLTLTLAVLGLGALLLPPTDLDEIATQALGAILFWSNHYSYGRFGYNVDTADGNWFLHTWSLSVEWQFYLVYPLLLASARWALGRAGVSSARRARLVTLALTVLTLASLGYYLVESRSNPRAAFFLLPARAWEFLAGGLAERWSRERSALGQRWRAPLSHVGLATIVLAAGWFGIKHVDPVGLGLPSLLPVLGATLVLVAAHTTGRLLGGRVAQAVGAWSYSIYLWHWPLIVGARVTETWDDHPALCKLSIAAASIVLGALSYRYVESVRRSERRVVNPRWAGLRDALPFGVLAVAAATAGVVKLTRGASFRLPEAMRGPRVSPRELEYFPARCSNYMKAGRDLRMCTITKDDRRRVLVIGDSHGENLYPWFNAKSEVSVDFFTEAECPPIPNFERMQWGFHCLDYATAAWRLAASPAYDTIVVSALWALAGGNGPGYCHVAEAGTCRLVKDQGERQALIRSELKSALRALLAKGKRVVVLDGTPEAPFNVPRRLEREQFWFGTIRSSIAFSSVSAEYGWIDVLFTEMSRQPGFHLVSLRPSLCINGKCSLWDSGRMRPIYTDDSHFAPEWIIRNCDFFTPFTRLTPPT